METLYSKRDKSTSFLDSFIDDLLKGDDDDREALKLTTGEKQQQQVQPEVGDLNFNEANNANAKNDEVEFSEKSIGNDAIASMETREDGEEEAETAHFTDVSSDVVVAVDIIATEIAMEIDADASKTNANKSNAESAIELEHEISKDNECDLTASAKKAFETEISEQQTNIIGEIEEEEIQKQSTADANVNGHQSADTETSASVAIIERTAEVVDSGVDDVAPTEPEPEQHQTGGGNANEYACDVTTTSGATDSEQQCSSKSETPLRYSSIHIHIINSLKETSIIVLFIIFLTVSYQYILTNNKQKFRREYERIPQVIRPAFELLHQIGNHQLFCIAQHLEACIEVVFLRPPLLLNCFKI